VARRNTYVARLNGIYTRNLDNAGITHVEGFARFTSPKSVEKKIPGFQPALAIAHY
jgi:glutathione reductase (NADPH)